MSENTQSLADESVAAAGRIATGFAEHALRIRAETDALVGISGKAAAEIGDLGCNSAAYRRAIAARPRAARWRARRNLRAQSNILVDAAEQALLVLIGESVRVRARPDLGHRSAQASVQDLKEASSTAA
jgi:hypothetical protein